MTELERQLALSSPDGRLITVVSPEELDESKERRTAPLAQWRDALREDTGLAKHVIGMVPANYPSDKRRTAATTMKMQDAEQRLDKFGEGFDQYLTKRTGKAIHTLLGTAVESCEVRRTPSWTELAPPQM